jgi:hypothetical protein
VQLAANHGIDVSEHIIILTPLMKETIQAKVQSTPYVSRNGGLKQLQLRNSIVTVYKVFSH